MTIKAGVVGLGFMGQRYVEFLHRMDGVEVSAICDIRQDLLRTTWRVQQALKHFPKPKNLPPRQM